MAITDILLALIILVSAWNGWRKGFILGMLELFTWAGSLLLALFMYQYVALLLGKFISSNTLLLPVSLIVTLLIVRFVAAYVSNSILAGISQKAHYSSANKVLGIVPGFLNGILYAALVAILLLLVPISDGVSNDVQKSRLADKFTVLGEWLQSKMNPVYEKLNRQSTIITENPGHEGTVKLPFTVKAFKPRPDLEAEMLVLVNKERAKVGLKALKADPEIAVVARKHSADMFLRGYFSHYTPEGKDPFDRMKAGGIRFLAAGENLAFAPTLAMAHEGLMNSPGHKANILHRSFGRLGIGILDGGMRGLMITQSFRN